MTDGSTEGSLTPLVESQTAGQTPSDTRSSFEAWLHLRSIEGLGDRALVSLVQAWASPEAVLRATRDDLVQSGCSPRLADAIRRGPSRDARRSIARELTTLRRRRIEVLTILDPSYPVRLRMIADPPPLLYLSGNLTEADALSIAIVGARRATPAGGLITEELARDLAGSGVTIVSGLARGIDAAAHRGALAGGGRTIAVLGCGIDRTYPTEHKELRRQIEERGAVLSELPIGSPPQSYNFPRRNRIISGLSLGVVVTEAAAGSGSLITAQLAAEQGREVFAVPGFVKEETSRGTNALLRDGATLVERATDVIEALSPQLDPSLRARLKQPRADDRWVEDFGIQERVVYDALSYEPKIVDRIAEETSLAVPVVMAALLSLELRRCVRHMSGQRYLRT
ncbi:MAG TPA: DNA-processing protein DprA [Nitrospira sp.]|nr:DNA-processing protein DprA [Nitrospira sp.]